MYKKFNLNEDKYIAVVVGAKRKQNRWPIEYFQEVIEYIIENGYKVLLIGGVADVEITRNLKVNENTILFCGKLTPLESASILKLCKLTITNDTGPMHISYAVDTPVVALFSARDFQNKWYPPKDKGVVFRDNSIECRICLSEICKNNKCMKSIHPSDVIKYLEKII
mgnify:CR=1 FL=1